MTSTSTVGLKTMNDHSEDNAARSQFFSGWVANSCLHICFRGDGVTISFLWQSLRTSCLWETSLLVNSRRLRRSTEATPLQRLALQEAEALQPLVFSSPYLTLKNVPLLPAVS